MPPEPAAKISRATGAVFRELSAGEGAVILNLESGQYHGVNQVGVLVWQLLDASPTFDELVAGVREHVADAPESVCADISVYVDALVDRGLATVEAPPAPA